MQVSALVADVLNGQAGYVHGRRPILYSNAVVQVQGSRLVLRQRFIRFGVCLSGARKGQRTVPLPDGSIPRAT